ncbi:MAG: exopolysaccharide biosynthesis protein [Oligoflexia bacterium]|nr:exopolysaccharide biosynthesis protein [Oligoflexia bacterium]MBF0366334.1 exopolysaccharide biosynthesis protein [Oligoflexia bacterium]
MPESNRSLLERCLAISEMLKEGQEITFGELLQKMGESGPLLLVVIISIPFLLPMPVPGLSVPFGIVIAFSGVAIALKRPLWLPRFFREKKFSVKTLQQIFATGTKFLRKIRPLFRERLTIVASSWAVQLMAGLLITLCGLLLALPLPPGTNFPPALIITLSAIGLLERDGLLLILAPTLLALIIIGVGRLIGEWH